MKLVIIGSGNVANVLGTRFLQAGHEIVQVVGRNGEAVTALASRLSAQACFEWSLVSSEADMYVLTLADAALYEFQPGTVFTNRLVVHTAGSVPASVLQRLTGSYGVLYPLQTLNKRDMAVGEIPFLVTANSSDATKKIIELASTISENVTITDDNQRAKIHLAATIVNNFCNHLFALAYEFCEKESLPFALLSPLISRTAALAGRGDPSLIQTGPAARKDLVTIARHESMLSAYPQLKLIYEMMSKNIMQRPGAGS